MKTNCRFCVSSLVIYTAAATGHRDCLFVRKSSQQQLLTDCTVLRILCFFGKRIIRLEVKTFKVFAPNPTRAVSNIACRSARGQTSHCLHTTTKLTWKVSCRLAIQLLLAQLVSISKAKHSPVHLEHSILLLALMTSPLGRSHRCRSVPPSQNIHAQQIPLLETKFLLVVG